MFLPPGKAANLVGEDVGAAGRVHEVKYRNLGASGLRVSALALGNWITHGGQVGEEAAHACVRAALDEGIIFFDTADIYARGRAEEVLGRALEDVPREHCVIATKVFWPMSDSPNDRGLSRKHIMASCHASLRRLQTDYIDLYQAHRFDPRVPLYETLRAFDDLVRQGKVHYIGISEWRADQIADALRIADDMGFDRIVSSQPQYSLLWRVPEAEVMPLCRKEGIGQIVWSPLAMGVLTGKYAPGRPPPAGSRGEMGKGIAREFLEEGTLRAVQRLEPIARDLGISMANLALAWVLANEDVAAAIVGATKPEQVHENVKAVEVELDDEVLRRIDEALGEVVIDDPAAVG